MWSEPCREVRRYEPDAVYLIIGRTHPEPVLRDGQAYRKMWQLVQDRDLGQHVAFVGEL